MMLLYEIFQQICKYAVVRMEDLIYRDIKRSVMFRANELIFGIFFAKPDIAMQMRGKFVICIMYAVCEHINASSYAFH